MNIKAMILKALADDVKYDGEIKTIVFQDMLYPGMTECRCFADNGDAFCCMFEDDDKITPFVKVPPKEGK